MKMWRPTRFWRPIAARLASAPRRTTRCWRSRIPAISCIPAIWPQTVCDREADIYDFFKLSHQLDAAVLVRASANRTVNRRSRYAQKDVLKLWDYMLQQAEAGSYTLQIPKRAKTKHCQTSTCTEFLAEDEWQVLFRKTHKNKPLPVKPPCAGDVVTWIARLGGFLIIGVADADSLSSGSSVILASKGDSGPPCGTPCGVASRVP